MSPQVAVVVTHLELGSREQLRPSTADPQGVQLRQEREPEASSIAAAMYRRVGSAWNWRDRLTWTPVEWANAINQPGVELWTLGEDGLLIGYFELELRDEIAEVKYFGLTPEGMGRGLGGWLLIRAVERAWARGAARVILNTCTLDSPAALPNYLARGFRLVRVEHQERELPE